MTLQAMKNARCEDCRWWSRWQPHEHNPEVVLHGDCRLRAPQLVMETRLREAVTREAVRRERSHPGEMDVVRVEQVPMTVAMSKWPSTRFDSAACGQFKPKAEAA